MISTLWCVLGLAGLLVGAELLIRAGTKLAALLKIPPIIIGLTVVSIGTSLPELAVGVEAALIGSGGLAVGNIAGTNTFNILFILGISAAMAPLLIERRTFRLDLPVMVLAALSLVAMAWDGRLSFIEGFALVAAAVIYSYVVIRGARQGYIVPEDVAAARPEQGGRRLFVVNAGLLVISIVIIILAADWLVTGAVGLARSFGVTESFIGLTIIAIGTSAPELVTTIVSTLRKQRDIAVGNLLGSSVYNVLLILGVTVMVAPGGLQVEPELVRIDIPLMALAALACVPIFLTGRRMSRLEGALFVAAYAGYLSYLILTRT